MQCKIILIIFAKVDGYIRKYGITKCLPLYPSSKIYEAMFERIRHFITLKGNIADVYSYKYMNIKIDFNVDLSLEERLAIHEVVILLNSIFNKGHNHYYYHVL